MICFFFTLDQTHPFQFESQLHPNSNFWPRLSFADAKFYDLKIIVDCLDLLFINTYSNEKRNIIEEKKKKRFHIKVCSIRTIIQVTNQNQTFFIRTEHVELDIWTPYNY